MKIAAIIPVKTFAKAKSRLELPLEKKIELCKIMLDEILHILAISPMIKESVVVTRDDDARKISEKYNAKILTDELERGVNEAVRIADGYVIEKGYDASIVFPQDIPLLKTQDIDFIMKFYTPPNFVIITPSRKFDGTNALVRMPPKIMGTCYDNDSYRNHMKMAKECTRNSALVFVKRIMTDVDDMDDLKYLMTLNEKPWLIEKIEKILG